MENDGTEFANHSDQRKWSATIASILSVPRPPGDCANETRRAEIVTFPNSDPLAFDTVACLSKPLGPSYAMLLYLVGFKTLNDVAGSHPVKIASLPGIGRKRLTKIASQLQARQMLNAEWRDHLGTGAS